MPWRARLCSAAVEELFTRLVAHGLLAVFVILFLDMVGVPLPSEVPLLFAGYLISTGELDLVPAALVATLGATVGALVLYAISRRFGRMIILRWGKFFLITPEHLERSERWFERRGDVAVFACRVIPLARTLISIPAGIAEMNVTRFTIYSFAGTLPWAFGLMAAGWALGENWRRILGAFTIVGLIVALTIVATGLTWYIRRRASLAGR